LSFQRFLGLQLCDTVPDAKTIWHFREELNQADILDAVFHRFVEQLEEKGIITRSGSIVDAVFVDVPRQRNNQAKSPIRARVEHVFARMNHFGGIFIRTIGRARAEFQIGLMNLTYNITRYVYLAGATA
jgi:hypothetical protein